MAGTDMLTRVFLRPETLDDIFDSIVDTLQKRYGDILPAPYARVLETLRKTAVLPSRVFFILTMLPREPGVLDAVCRVSVDPDKVRVFADVIYCMTLAFLQTPFDPDRIDDQLVVFNAACGDLWCTKTAPLLALMLKASVPARPD